MLKAISLIIKLIPVILAGIRLVEEISKDGDWTSAAKKEAALRAIKELSTSLGFTISDTAMDVISKVVDIAITILNAAGILHTSKPVENPIQGVSRTETHLSS